MRSLGEPDEYALKERTMEWALMERTLTGLKAWQGYPGPMPCSSGAWREAPDNTRGRLFKRGAWTRNAPAYSKQTAAGVNDVPANPCRSLMKPPMMGPHALPAQAAAWKIADTALAASRFSLAICTAAKSIIKGRIGVQPKA
mmetsp:Transcript_157084/g.381595  ORF Transcript_157084/g.381595 Transcript_157084/m.381595 type:complete len:142 (-) Transcript_157084:1086-1511(-)